MENIIRTENLSKQYEDINAVSEISLNVRKGERLGKDKNTKGTGLGLYIIRHILENRLDGKIKADIKDGDWIKIDCYIEEKSFKTL